MKDVSMFCGKGGVGKTTCAAATALHYSAAGHRTLVISTDPTPSLRHIFELDGPASTQKPVAVAEGLYLDEIGSDEVRRMWDDRFGAEVYEVFSSFVDIDYTQFVDFVASILPGIRDEFMVDYIRELRESGEYERIVWDTAPAGQTLGLLRMPAVVNRHLKPAPRIYTSLRTTGKGRRTVHGVIRGWEELSNRDIAFLQGDVEFNLVTIPEALAVRQLEAICGELELYGLNIDNVIINQVVTAPDSEFLQRRSEMQQGYMAQIADRYGGKQRLLPLFHHEVKGLERLRKVASVLFDNG